MSLVEVHLLDGWTELRLNRPERRNALSSQLAEELMGAISTAEAHGPTMVLAANGPVFCAGADLSEGVSLKNDRPSTRIAEALMRSPLFIVAVVESPVYGAGISLIVTCPVVIATKAASLGFPESTHGFFPLGVAPWVDRFVTPRRLVELGMTGGSLNAEDAMKSGLFTELVERDQVTVTVDRWMKLAVTKPAIARQAKQYWNTVLESDDRRGRIKDLESLLADRLTPPSASRSTRTQG